MHIAVLAVLPLSLIALASSITHAQEDRRGLNNRTVAIHGVDRRISVRHDKGSDLAPLGMVVNKTLKSSFTAFLVDECHVMANAHSVTGTKAMDFIVIDANDQAKLDSIDLEFYVGQTATTPFSEKTKANVVKLGDFNPMASLDEHDFALLRLKDCLGTTDKYGYFELFDAPLGKIQGIKGFFRSPGYPGDRDLTRGAWEDPECTVYGGVYEQPNVWASDCNLLPGASGAPLLRRGDDGKLYVFGIGTSEFMTNGGMLQEYEPATANRYLASTGFSSKVRPLLGKSRK